MDNFSIFKLLTCAFDFFQKKNGIKNNKEDISKSQFPFNLDSLFKKKEEDNSNIQNEQIDKPINSFRISSELYKTIKNHDEFVNRVENNNKKES